MLLWSQAELGLRALASRPWASHLDLAGLSSLISRLEFAVRVRDNTYKPLAQFLALVWRES